MRAGSIHEILEHFTTFLINFSKNCIPLMDPVLLRGIPDGIYLNSNFFPTFSFFGIIFFGFVLLFAVERDSAVSGYLPSSAALR